MLIKLNEILLSSAFYVLVDHVTQLEQSIRH